MKTITKLLFVICCITVCVAITACQSGNTPVETASDADGSPADSDDTPADADAPTDNTLTADADNVLVVYFSWSSSHNTERMANMIAEKTGGSLFELEPETPYTTDYNEVLDVAQNEQRDNARPALAENLSQEEISEYDVIFVGYPIWWYDAPMIIYSFLESHDFTDITLIPFATSGGSDISEEETFGEITGTVVRDGLCISNIDSASAEDEIDEWLTGLGFELDSSV